MTIDKQIAQILDELDVLRKEVKELRVLGSRIRVRPADKECVINLWLFIMNNDGCSKSDIYGMPQFSRNKLTRVRQYKDWLTGLDSVLREESCRLEIKKGNDGKTVRHYVTESL